MLVNLQKLNEQVKEAKKLPKEEAIAFFDSLKEVEKSYTDILEGPKNVNSIKKNRRELEDIVSKRFPKVFSLGEAEISVKAKEAYSYFRRMFKDLRSWLILSPQN